MKKDAVAPGDSRHEYQRIPIPDAGKWDLRTRTAVAGSNAGGPSTMLPTSLSQGFRPPDHRPPDMPRAVDGKPNAGIPRHPAPNGFRETTAPDRG